MTSISTSRRVVRATACIWSGRGNGRAALSEKDIRMTLLEHFSGPAVENEVDQAGLIRLCESGFEREFFGMLVQRGFPPNEVATMTGR
jgi:hypothetical protein